MDGLKVVPLLLQEGGKEVEGHDNVLSELIIGHLLVTGSNVEAGDLLELPLDGSLNVVDLLLEWVVVSNWLWEHTNSVKDWTEDNWDLLDKSISGEEEGVFLGPLLDLLLILVEFLQVIKVGAVDLDTRGFELISVLLIGNQADLEVWSWDVWESDGSNESLIFLWIIILKGNLELNSLHELSLLGFFSHLLDALNYKSVGDFTHSKFSI